MTDDPAWHIGLPMTIADTYGRRSEALGVCRVSYGPLTLDGTLEADGSIRFSAYVAPGPLRDELTKLIRFSVLRSIAHRWEMEDARAAPIESRSTVVRLAQRG